MRTINRFKSDILQEDNKIFWEIIGSFLVAIASFVVFFVLFYMSTLTPPVEDNATLSTNKNLSAVHN